MQIDKTAMQIDKIAKKNRSPHRMPPHPPLKHRIDIFSLPDDLLGRSLPGARMVMAMRVCSRLNRVVKLGFLKQGQVELVIGALNARTAAVQDTMAYFRFCRKSIKCVCDAGLMINPENTWVPRGSLGESDRRPLPPSGLIVNKMFETLRASSLAGKTAKDGTKGLVALRVDMPDVADFCYLMHKLHDFCKFQDGFEELEEFNVLMHASCPGPHRAFQVSAVREIQCLGILRLLICQKWMPRLRSLVLRVAPLCNEPDNRDQEQLVPFFFSGLFVNVGKHATVKKIRFVFTHPMDMAAYMDAFMDGCDGLNHVPYEELCVECQYKPHYFFFAHYARKALEDLQYVCKRLDVFFSAAHLPSDGAEMYQDRLDSILWRAIFDSDVPDTNRNLTTVCIRVSRDHTGDGFDLPNFRQNCHNIQVALTILRV
jgi:hypothetical protein